MYIANTFPYFDDFDASKNYSRILFRPGRAVQARELTQLQTTLQNQVGTLGQTIFREGSFAFDNKSPVLRSNLDYVKLQTTYNGIDADDVLPALLNTRLTNNTNVTATVVQIALAEDGDPPTLWLNYESAGDDGITKNFANNDILTQYVDGTANINVRALNTAATGYGTAVGLYDNYIFIRNTFVKIDTQLAIVSKYINLSSNSIGFQVNEEIVTFADDTSLRDPAVKSEGSDDSNYYALGADRFKLTVSMVSRSLEDTTVDPNYIEVIRIDNNQATWVRQDVVYDVLNRELAKRTFEESGDYVVDCFPLQLVEHNNDSNAKIVGYYNAGGNANLMVAIMGPGLAYVKGYRIESRVNAPINIQKPRTFTAVDDTALTIEYGNYIDVEDAYNIPKTDTNLETLTFYSQYKTNKQDTTGRGKKIGTARARFTRLFSSGINNQTSNQAVGLRLYIFDIKTEPGRNLFRQAKSVVGTGMAGIGFSANIATTINSQLTGSVSTTAGSNIVTGTQTFFTLEISNPTFDSGSTSSVDAVSDYITIIDSANSTNTLRLEVASVSGLDTLVANSNAASNIAVGSYFLSTFNLRGTENEAVRSYLTKIPYDFVKSVDANNDSTVYTIRSMETATLTSNVATLTIGGGTADYWGAGFGDSLIAITSGTSAGNVIPAAQFCRISNDGKTLTVDLSTSGRAGVASADIALVVPRIKTLTRAQRNLKTLNTDRAYTVNSNSLYTQALIKLDRADGVRLVSVYKSATGSTTFSSVGAKDITRDFDFFDGQTPTHYDLAYVVRKPYAVVPDAPIQITFDYYSHSGSGDYFSVDSYTDSGISYENIPTFKSPSIAALYRINSDSVRLSDFIDNRPVIDETGDSFNSTGGKIPAVFETGSSFTTKLEYYLARNALICLNTEGKFEIKYGSTARNNFAQDPSTPEDSMPLYMVRMAPYVTNIDRDVQIENLCAYRYTMKDIGKLDRRITNLEYYTSLNLLEKSTESLSVKDAFGLERFKNGFVVDNFTSFGVMDPTSTIAIDFRNNELRPKFNRKTF